MISSSISKKKLLISSFCMFEINLTLLSLFNRAMTSFVKRLIHVVNLNLNCESRIYWISNPVNLESTEFEQVYKSSSGSEHHWLKQYIVVWCNIVICSVCQTLTSISLVSSLNLIVTILFQQYVFLCAAKVIQNPSTAQIGFIQNKIIMFFYSTTLFQQENTNNHQM